MYFDRIVEKVADDKITCKGYIFHGEIICKNQKS